MRVSEELLAPIFTAKVGVTGSSETFMCIYQTTQCHISEDYHLSLKNVLKSTYIFCLPFQDGVVIMFIKMEEPKDFVTWLQVAKVMILAYFVGGTAENEWYFNTVISAFCNWI